MSVEQTAATHCIIHFAEAGHGDHETKDIRIEIWTYGRIEETDKRTPTSLRIFNNGLRDNGAAAGTEQRGDSIMRIVIEECPGGKAG